MSKQGILISTAENQEGARPKIITPSNRFPIDDMGTAVARGEVPGATPFGAYGYREAGAGESNRVIWPDGAFKIPATAGVQMSIASTSVNDAAAGTHARVVELHYLDNNLAIQSELVTLNGTTPVLTVATNIRFINEFHCHEFGANIFADGVISASNGGIVYGQIAAKDVEGASSARMVPANKVCYVAGAVGGAVSGTAAARAVLKIAASERDGDQYITPLVLFPLGGVAVQDTSSAFQFPVPLKFAAGTIVTILETTDKAASITGSWFGWLEDA